MLQILLVWLIILVVLTIRAILPRYKTDALITIIWKYLLPVLLIDLLFLLIYLA